MVILHSYVNVYQRVTGILDNSLGYTIAVENDHPKICWLGRTAGKIRARGLVNTVFKSGVHSQGKIVSFLNSGIFAVVSSVKAAENKSNSGSNHSCPDVFIHFSLLKPFSAREIIQKLWRTSLLLARSLGVGIILWDIFWAPRLWGCCAWGSRLRFLRQLLPPRLDVVYLLGVC